MRPDPARRAALEVLTRVRERSAYAHETLDAVLRATPLEHRDAAFATRLAYGAVAARGTLDEAVIRCLNPGTVLTPRIGDVLSLGAYEILFAETPRHAAVSEAVELARAVDKRAAGLVNAVMRRVADSSSDFPWGDPATDDEALARLHGHPPWIADLWIAELGREQAAEIMSANNLPAPLFLAHLPHHRSAADVEASFAAEGVELEPGPLAGSWIATSPSALRSSPTLERLDALVMDAGAQFATRALIPRPDSHIAEIGAGRGGKTLLLAALARQSGGPARSITAIDLHGFKLDALARSAERVSFDEVAVVHADAASPTVELGVADGSLDAVLIDAPCSGLGTLRRHPDRRWRARPEEIDALAALGGRLLERASQLVRPEGFVVYSTCTIARRENADVIAAFLSSDAGSSFSVDSLAGDVPEQWNRFVSPEGWFQSLPKAGGADGHFVARLVRASDG